MDNDADLAGMNDAVKHCRAGLKALEYAHSTLKEGKALYSTHVQLATIELAKAIENAMKVAIRNQ